MKYFVALFIFCLVLFLYLHIYYHFKTSDELEAYTIERPSKSKLEEICDLRQPVVFEFSCNRLTEGCGIPALEGSYGAFDLKIRNVKQDAKDTEMYLPFLLKEAVKLFRNDEDCKFITENNGEFLTETGVVKNLKYNDSFLRPPMVSKCSYDLWAGSTGCRTPLRYNIDYRHFIYLASGSAKLKLISPHSSKHLYTVKDYDNFEFRSPVNPWAIQQEYKADFDKVKTLDLQMTNGVMIYIPAYWWYTIEYEEVSSILSFSYRTYMNTLAILPELFMCFLQNQNIKMEVAKKVDV